MFERRNLSRDEAILAVVGSLSGDNVGEFHKDLDEMVEGGFSRITLDLSKTDSINSSALGKILLFRKKLAEQERTLQIRGCSESLYKTFQMIKFDTLISIKR
jgi:anti-anti-sigma factor